MPDPEACLRAMRSRDARFDGRFCTAVRTTRIYCRPSCPALTPRTENVSFFPSAAAAQDAGYRACRRCRPDAVPGSPDWDARGDVVARTVRLIADGVVDREGVSGLASRLGYSVRHLQRLTQRELGASPLALARSQRAHTARLLIETTDLPMSEVAFAAGFGSIRSFNEAVTLSYARTPSELRARRPARRPTVRTLGQVDLRLPFRAPFEPGNVFGHLAATAVPGVEEWRDGRYRRTVRLPHGPGIVALRPMADHVAASLWLADPRDLTPAIGRCRRLLDLDADPVAVDAHLAADPALRPLVTRAPGRRVPRTVDPAEFALRAVLGQQVSTAAARTHAARLVQRFGETVSDPGGTLTHLFPTPAALAVLRPADLGMPASRVATLSVLAAALADGDLDLSPSADWAEARGKLAAIPGIGAWTLEIIAMRALGDPDAFPATDLGVRRALAGLSVGPAESHPWRPWRSYATQYLWATLPHSINRIPTPPDTVQDHPARIAP